MPSVRSAGRLRDNTRALLIGNGSSALLAFALSALIGRTLGETGLGIYAASLAWVLPLSLLAECGFGTLITRDVAADLSRAPAYLRATTLARLPLSLGLMTLLWLAAPRLSDEAAIVTGLRLSAPLIAVQPFFGAFSALFRAHQRMWPVAWLNLGMLSAQVGLTALALALGGDIVGVLTLNTLSSGAQLLAAWLWYRRHFHQPEEATPIDLRDLLRGAWPFAVAALLAALHLRLNVILLENLSGLAQVGLYAAAMRFIEAGRMLPQAFFDALFPTLTALADDERAFQRLFRRALLAVSLFAVFAFGGAWLLGDVVVRLVYGDAFGEAVGVLQIGALSLWPLLTKNALILRHFAHERERFVNQVTLATLLLRLLLGWALIPTTGALGAAWVSLLTETLAFMLLFRLSDHGQGRYP